MSKEIKNPAMIGRTCRIQLMKTLLEQEQAKGIVDKTKFLAMYMFNSGVTKKLAQEYWDLLQAFLLRTPVPELKKTVEPEPEKTESIEETLHLDKEDKVTEGY